RADLETWVRSTSPLVGRAVASCRRSCSFFFFKQKTAYEIGLGIPAEPLFRSESLVDGERSQSKSFSSCARIGRIFSFSASSPLRLIRKQAVVIPALSR